VYEDWRRSIEERAGDLVAQMTIEEKAGLMVGSTLPMGPNGGVSEQASYGTNPFKPGGPASGASDVSRHLRGTRRRPITPEL
jgi:hypothetical protein